MLAQSEIGYENLMKLSSACFLEVEATELPHIKLSHLQAHHEGLIVLTGGGDGFINRLDLRGATRHGKRISWEIVPLV